MSGLLHVLHSNDTNHLWQTCYRFRVISDDIVWSLRSKEGMELKFGQGPYKGHPNMPKLPDPRICNLRLSLSRIFHSSGMAEVMEKYRMDEEDVMAVEDIHFGNEEIDDSVLLEYMFSRLGGMEKVERIVES